MSKKAAKKAAKKAGTVKTPVVAEAAPVVKMVPPPTVNTVPPPSVVVVPLPAVPVTTTDKPKEVTLVQVTDAAGKRYESKTDPTSNYHLRNRSQVLKPCQIVRNFCAANPGMARKDVIATLVSQGVDKNTAATQYSLWKAKQPAAVLAVEVPATGQEEGEDVTMMEEVTIGDE